MPIVEVKVKIGPTTAEGGESVKVLALLDSGSDGTYCAKELVERVGISGEPTTVVINSIDNVTRWDTSRVDLQVEAARSKKARKILMRGVVVLDSFPLNLKGKAACESDLARWKYLPSAEEMYVNQGRDAYPGVELLIGLDQTQALKPLEIRRGGDGQPFAVRTVLGWTVQGRRTYEAKDAITTGLESIANFARTVSQGDTLEELVKRFWITDEPTCREALERDEMSGADRYVINLWDQRVARDGEHYVLPIPFKDKHDPQLNNWGQARRRLESLRARLRKDHVLKTAYIEEIRKLVKAGYAERVPARDQQRTANRTWYLPHHPVLNPNKPGKVRIVFDCASTDQGVSLNTQVLQGPDLTNNLVGILLRFRQRKVAVTADIEAMFYQINVAKEDRDSLRFVWKDPGQSQAPLELFRMKVHVFGGIWSPACAAYALQRTLLEHGRDHAAALEGVGKNFYVDDLLHSLDTEEQAQRLSVELTRVLRRGGFRLTKWSSSHPGALRDLPPEDRGEVSGKSVHLPADLPETRALGIVWDQSGDKIAVRTNVRQRAETRRGMLGTFSSVYDPLGMVAPFLIRAKIMFQEECRRNESWDAPLACRTIMGWRKWMEELRVLSAFKMPRYCLAHENTSPVRVELHTFSDASQLAYGTVSYLRYVQNGRRSVVAFVLGKSRLAPMKGATIPRLELCAAKLAVEMAAVITSELDIRVDETVFWTDSMLVLQYINNPSRRFKTYVANRVAAIQRLSRAHQWRHLPSELNPADDVSRGLTAAQLVAPGRWADGPEFLRCAKEEWPITPEPQDVEDGDMEVQPAITLSTVATADEPNVCERLWSHYSCWNRMRRAAAWWVRFAHWVARGKPKSTSYHFSKVITAEEMMRTGTGIIRTIQRKCFGETIRVLQRKERLPKADHLASLEPHMGRDGLLRVGGRLRNADIGPEARTPCLLPKDHPVTSVIVRHVHRTVAGHMGREHTTASIRMNYWIPKIRHAVDRELKACVTCRRANWRQRHLSQADLPEDRVALGGPPFAATGLDCFGPFIVTVGRRREKRWGCLFTCLSIRAIHLETLEKLDAGDLIMALTRFTSRRGTTPSLLRSDNGTNMVRASKDIAEAARSWRDDQALQKETAKRGIKWIFNPPGAPHMGGVWERQIKTVKGIMEKIVGTQPLDDTRLRTLFCEVERIVNNRPLTPSPASPDELAALTPAHALHAHGDPGPFLGSWDLGDCIKRRWRHAQWLADRFWDRWLKEYLPTLRKRHRKPHMGWQPAVGDVVLVTDEISPRNQWPLARVIRVFPSPDGVVRRVRVRTAKGTLMRASINLCPLEDTKP